MELSSHQLTVLQENEFHPYRVESVLPREIEPNISISCVAVNLAGVEQALYQSPEPCEAIQGQYDILSRVEKSPQVLAPGSAHYFIAR